MWHYLLLALRMEVDSTHSPCHLIKTYIVEPFETRAHNFPNAMIWHQEVLFPPHEDVLPLCAILVVEIRFLRLLRQRPPRRELSPMLHICLVCGAPRLVFGLKRIFRADNLAFKVRSQGRMVFGKAYSCVQLSASGLNAIAMERIPSMRR